MNQGSSVIDIKNLQPFYLVYLGFCLIVSLPLILSVIGLLFTFDVPAGADNANHEYYIKRIIETKNLLISYTQFPEYSNTDSENVERYYPSFLHIFISFISILLDATDPEDIIKISSIFILLAFIAGIIGFSLLIIEIINNSIFGKTSIKYNQIGLENSFYIILLSSFAFTILIFSISPIIKTINDGTYAEIFAMWTLFPIYIIFLLKNKWLFSAILLSIIASTHNLSLIMSLIVSFAILIHFLVLRDFQSVKKFLLAISVFLLLSIPTIYFFYLPTLNDVLENKAGNLQFTISIPDIISQLTPLLFYSALFSSFILLTKYKSYLWISLWIFFFFITFTYSSLLGVRTARESSVIFGLGFGICLTYLINAFLFSNLFKGLIKKSKFFRNGMITRIAVITIIMTIISPVYFVYHHEKIIAESNPLLVMYFSPAFSEMNTILKDIFYKVESNEGSQNKYNIVIFGHNPWMKLFLYNEYTVYETVSKDIGDTLGTHDRKINEELLKILYEPSALETECILDEFNIDYIFVGDDMESRYYTPYQKSVFYKDLNLFQRFNQSPFIDLHTEVSGLENENLRLYSINSSSFSNKCL